MRRHGAGFMVDDLDYAAAETQDPRPLAVGSRLDKHGFYPEAKSAEVSLVFWTGVFLSPGRRIRVIGKETGPGPGGYG